MMIALTVHITAVVLPASLGDAAKLLAIGSKMLACAAVLWLLLALPGFLAERDGVLAGGAPEIASAHARR